MEHFRLVDIARTWKACAGMPKGFTRNIMFWTLVRRLESTGYVGHARHALERIARWA